jgi:phosphohistidine phosphatase
MDLYVIRHAVAEPRREDLPDADRALTDKGRSRFTRGVRGMGRLGIRFERVLHSPWRRAMETAELLVPLLDGTSRVTNLLAESPTGRLLEELGGDAVAVVGHEPWLGELVAWLVIGDTSAGDRFVLDKGAVVHLRGVGAPQPGTMVLVESLPLRALRRVARG